MVQRSKRSLHAGNIEETQRNERLAHYAGKSQRISGIFVSRLTELAATFSFGVLRHVLRSHVRREMTGRNALKKIMTLVCLTLLTTVIASEVALAAKCGPGKRYYNGRCV